jgi:translation initiation factor 3 subunit D
MVFDSVPYAHFDKKDKCNKAADFTQSQPSFQKTYSKYNRREDNSAITDFSYRHDSVEDSTFQLVDSTKTTTKRYSSSEFICRRSNLFLLILLILTLVSKKGWSQQNRQAAGRANRNTATRGTRTDNSTAFGGRGMGSKRVQNLAGRGGRGGRGYVRRDNRKMDRAPSLTVEADWELLEEFDLAQLLKLVANPPKVEDLSMCGFLDQYDETYDKLTTRSAKPLKRVDNKIFYAVTTEDDPILGKYAAEGAGDVFATDAILSHLMAAPRSVYSWDIVIQKADGMIFLDKREGSTFDFLTVSETAREPPSSLSGEDVDEINQPTKLSIEATMINQNFSQQVLKSDPENRKSVG